VLEVDGALALSSPVYETVWLPRRETVASCRSRADAWSWLPHAAPAEDCRCGIYAARTPAQAASLLAGRRLARARHAVCAALGRVFLWGSVVECEQGWRAERAYPAALYLPALAPRPSGGRLGRFLRRRRGASCAPEVARGLSAYGVSVELIACRTIADLAGTLAADPRMSLKGGSG
jgi:hypothetical protein